MLCKRSTGRSLAHCKHLVALAGGALPGGIAAAPAHFLVQVDDGVAPSGS